MGDAKRRLDVANERISTLEQVYKIIQGVQKDQAIIMNILIKKAEVTKDEIDKETVRLITQLEKRKRDIESSKIQPKGPRAS